MVAFSRNRGIYWQKRIGATYYLHGDRVARAPVRERTMVP